MKLNKLWKGKKFYTGAHKENLAGGGVVGKNGRVASDIGTNRFRLTLNKEELVTPNFRMTRVLDMIEERPNINSGIHSIIRFLITKLVFKGDDERSVEFLNRWVKQRDTLKGELNKYALLKFGAGTSYLEPVWVKRAAGRVLDNLFHVPDPATIWLNLNTTSDEDYWILELPFDVRAYDGVSSNYYPINYLRGSYISRRYIWGIKYPKKKFFQGKYGWSRNGFYGGGLLGSGIDNYDTEEEILKNWALVAKYRAMGKKIISFLGRDGETVDPDELDDIQAQFAALEEEDSLLINREVKDTDLTFTGQDNSMDAQIEYLRKDTGSCLVPNYMTAFSQDSSMATAAEAKVPFSLSLAEMQEELRIDIRRMIVMELKKTFNFIDTEVEIDLGEPELYSRSERFEIANSLYLNKACTFNELRVAGGYKPVEGGDRWVSDDELPLLGGKASTRALRKEMFPLTEKFKNKSKVPKYYESIKENVLCENTLYKFEEAKNNIIIKEYSITEELPENPNIKLKEQLRESIDIKTKVSKEVKGQFKEAVKKFLK